MPAELVAHVWAQSSSPLYAEKIVQKAMAAVQMKAITPEDALDYLDLPMTEQLKPRRRKLAQAQSEKGEKVMELKEREVSQGVEGGQGGLGSKSRSGTDPSQHRFPSRRLIWYAFLDALMEHVDQ